MNEVNNTDWEWDKKVFSVDWVSAVPYKTLLRFGLEASMLCYVMLY